MIIQILMSGVLLFLVPAVVGTLFEKVNIGPKKPLFYYLICKGTVEERIYRNLQEGKDFDERMFEGYLKGE